MTKKPDYNQIKARRTNEYIELMIATPLGVHVLYLSKNEAENAITELAIQCSEINEENQILKDEQESI